jgi:hypothetical protein
MSACEVGMELFHHDARSSECQNKYKSPENQINLNSTGTSSLPQKNIGYNITGINQRRRTQRRNTGLYYGLVECNKKCRCTVCLDSSVGIVTSLRIMRSVVRFPAKKTYFSLHRNVQTNSIDHPAS